MRILMGYRYGDFCPADRIKVAMKKLGHEVVVAGPSSDPVIHHEIEASDSSEAFHAGVYYYDVRKIVDAWGRFDLILQIEPGVFLYNLEKVSILNAAWWIDSFTAENHPFVQAIGGKKWIDSLDWIFTAKIPQISEYHRHGIRNVSHLALAYDEDIHHEAFLATGKPYDVVFCGRVDYVERTLLLDILRTRYKVFVGSGTYDDYCRIIAQGKIAFNHGHIGEMNMRFFELMAMSAFQVCNIVHGQEAFGFVDGVHLVNYVTFRDLSATVEHYLNSEEEREEIAKAGRQKVLEGHSYMDRAKEILEQMSLA